MGKIITKFDVEDVVFTVDSDGDPVKRIVEKIRVSGDNKIEYGFRISSDYGILGSLYRGDGYSWFDEGDTFATKKDARAEARSKKVELKKRRDDLQKELEEVEEELDELED